MSETDDLAVVGFFMTSWKSSGEYKVKLNFLFLDQLTGNLDRNV